jgi:hypothetical protein
VNDDDPFVRWAFGALIALVLSLAVAYLGHQVLLLRCVNEGRSITQCRTLLN